MGSAMKPSKRIWSGSKIGILAAALWVVPIASPAQTILVNRDSGPSQPPTLSPVDVTPNPNGRGDGMYIPLTKDQPFKVKFNVEIVKPLPDGSLVKQKYYVIAARNSAGYEYRESRDVVPSDSDREPVLISTTLYDPKNSTATLCFPSRQNCQRRSFDPALQPVEQPGLGVTESGGTTIRRESLGKKQMDGLEAEGVRETQTVKAGVNGNDKPLVTTRETWYSPRLNIYLSVMVTDPFGATRKVEATDLKLGEPAGEWFAIPEGYRILAHRIVGAPVRVTPTLEQMVKQHINGTSEEQLTEELKPVEAAVLNYAKAHAAAAPNDPLFKSLNVPLSVSMYTPVSNPADTEANDIASSRFVNNLRMHLSSEVQSMQMNEQRMNRTQVDDATARMSEAYRLVLASPCMNKPAPGDPPTMPGSAAALEAEQKAWVQVYEAWTAFLKGLFPNGNAAGFGFQLTNERAGELRRMQTVERNRGCIPQESMEASVERLVPAQTPAQLSAALKPVDAAVNAYIKTHVADQPNGDEENFARMLESRLASDLQQQERGRAPTSDQFEEAELHLNQAFRKVIESPCIDRHIPGDPPDAPASGDKLRAEETAWLAMRDAWVKFVASLYPNNGSAGFGYSMTEQRANELRQVQNIERNRGCRSDDGN
jgi:uncharacterized protein YecT (DUF1311 family)